MWHRKIGRAAALGMTLALVASASSVRAGGSGVHFGTATIASTPLGFSGDGQPAPYDNSGADEVAFGVRGPFPSNYFHVVAGGPKSNRFTTAQGTFCEKTIFTVTSTKVPDWLTDGGTHAVDGRARLLCDRADRTRVEYRWGYAANCVVIGREGRANGVFTFNAGDGCTATVSMPSHGSQEVVAEGANVPFHVTGNR